MYAIDRISHIYLLGHVIIYLSIPSHVVEGILGAIEIGYNKDGAPMFYCPTCDLPAKIRKAHKCVQIPKSEWQETRYDTGLDGCIGYFLSHPLINEINEIIQTVSSCGYLDLENQPHIMYYIKRWYDKYLQKYRSEK